MKYYKDEILNKWLAKFKDIDFENKFHVDLYSKRFKLIYLIAIYVIIQSVSHMIFVSGFDFYFFSSVIASLFFMIFIKYTPRKYSQYIIMLTQIYTTYSICSLNQLNTDKNRELYYLNGITQVMYWIVECQNFLAESISLLISFGIITYYQVLPHNYSINYFFSIIIICFYKYIHNINDRKLYLALKNFQEWERLSEKILPNLFILQSFDYRTHRMQVYDCNERAKQYQIDQSQDKYIQFLNQMKIEEFLTVVNPIDSLFKNQGIYTLKDYLLKKHEEIYRVYIESDANTQTKYQQMKRKNLQSSPNQTSQIKYWKENNGGQDYVEDLSVSMINQETEKRVCFKVKIFVLHMNEPFLIICMEDISIFQENKYLKEKQLNQIDLIQELVKCLEDKMQYIQYTKQYAIRNLQRKIMQFKIILQSFQQNFKLLNVQQFSFSEVIDKIKLIFVDQNIKILGEYSDLLVFSDKKYIFKSIFVIIASLGVENINSIEISQVKDKLSERIILNIHAKNHEQINEQEKSFYLFDLKLYPKINSLCFKYLKNLMKFICLRDKPDITLIGDNQIEIQIEYLTDIRQLSDLKYTQDKLIQSPALSKKQTSVSMLNITKSQYFQTQTNNFIRYTPKQSSLKYKCPIREQESDEFSEYQFRLDSMHSSHLGVKFPSREIGTPKLKDQPIANFVYNFKKINTLQNQRNNII
ncbi:transmembrane protein, putative (macronuclear) [Tetrahymena thermophila SB210]|uniref:Transmembrane protein, putative n=1 Tax=Tetrahymena thermophila (strain SB210) TaxID=312017 RepID=Q230T7_TETTS|nr:transmembrane protein, putative [Tetrahymena thermophila SB210]EAR91202.2 transmembrane protein, putative [Tetrahymena thermophila SB210]|eukprot:XP_001011447.2 transmembrane protein, putative [Tetrahymena thermophila SB210]